MRATVCFVGMLFLAGCNGVEGAADTAVCPAGSSSVVSIESWTIAPTEAGNTQITLWLTSETATRMIDGSVVFWDALGRGVGKVAIDKDANFVPGATYVQDGTYRMADRLQTLRKEDVTAVACVRAVLYEDGTTERFD